MTGQGRLSFFAALATGLAALSLGGIFRPGDWLWPTLGGVATVGACGALARRLRLPLVTQPAFAILGLTGWLTLVYASSVAPLIVIPGRGALEHLVNLAEVGVADIKEHAAPITPAPGVTMLTVVGVGLVAVAVDTIAVSMRRPAVAGLALLAIYCVPASVSVAGVGWAAFALGGAGWLALLLADSQERIGRWGRPLGFRADDRHTGDIGEIETSPMAAVGRRIGVTAVGLAVAVPAVLPSIDEGLFGWGDGPGFGRGGGNNTVTVANPLVSLQRDLNRPDNFEVLRYRTTADQPDYLRLVTLDKFNGTSWEPAKLSLSQDNRVNRPLPDPPGLSASVAQRPVESVIDVGERHRSKWLALPYPPREIRIEEDWRYDAATLNVFSPQSTSQGMSYRVVSLEITPTADQLRSAESAPVEIRERYLDIPDDLPPIFRRLVNDVTAGKHTAFDKANALERWFRSSAFHYSTTARGGNSASVLEDFLNDRVGYCEQFAATMALMARYLGIPARVNVGFTPGAQQEDGSYLVRAHDYHSWPELYFSGAGWVRFEPTPTSDGRTVEPPWTNEESAGGAGTSSATTDPTSGAIPRGQATNPNEFGGDRLEDRTAIEGGGGAGDGGFPVVPTLIRAGVVLLLALPSAARMAVRRRRWARAGGGPERYAAAAWDELRDSALDLGYAWRRSETPRQLAGRLIDEGGLAEPASGALTRIGRAVERARYARSAGEVGDLRGDVGAAVRGLRRGVGRWRRWRARLLPRSTRRLVTDIAERVADALDWVDAVGARLRLKIRRQLPLPRG
jgi:transglutaminase-like putative cysteine protease